MGDSYKTQQKFVILPICDTSSEGKYVHTKSAKSNHDCLMKKFRVPSIVEFMLEVVRRIPFR